MPPYPPERGWAEFEGRGILAVHATGKGRPEESVELNLLVENLDQIEANLKNAGHSASRRMLGEGPVLDVAITSGAKLTIGGGARTANRGPSLLERSGSRMIIGSSEQSSNCWVYGQPLNPIMEPRMSSMPTVEGLHRFTAHQSHDRASHSNTTVM